MTKIIDITKNRSEFLTRHSNDFKEVTTNNGTKSILAPDKFSDFVNRVYGNKIEENYNPTKVYTKFKIIKVDPAKVPDDANKEKAKINQEAITIVKNNDNTYTINADKEVLQSYPSLITEEGIHQWVGILVSTGEASITTIKLNGEALTSSDVSEAKAVGGNDGDILLWVKFDGNDAIFTLELNKKVSVIGLNLLNTHKY